MKSFITVSFFLLITFISCQKDFGDLGSKIMPASEKFYIANIDTTSFKAYTVVDTMKIKSNSVNLLGSYYDPIFGVGSANFLTQIALLAPNTNFPDTVEADSLILKLYYNSYYRNTDDANQEDFYDKSTSLQWISVYSLNSDFSNNIDSTYYNDFIAEEYYSENDLLTKTYFRPTKLKLFEITLPYWLADTLLKTNPANYVDNSSLREFFKGLYVKVDQVEEGGVIYYIDLNNTESNLSLYYSHETDTVPREYKFPIDATCAKVNVFKHNYENSGILNIGDTINQDTVVYLQAMSGLKSVIEIPYLNSWFDSSNLIINMALLTFYVEEENTYIKQYPVPDKLKLAGKNENGTAIGIPEYFEVTPLGIVYNGTSYNADTKSYTFNITSYFQSLIRRDTEINGFYLYPDNSTTTANRVVLNSGNNSYPIKLKITYSKL